MGNPPQCGLTRRAETGIGRPAGQGLRFLLCSGASAGLDNFLESYLKIGENMPALLMPQRLNKIMYETKHSYFINLFCRLSHYILFYGF